MLRGKFVIKILFVLACIGNLFGQGLANPYGHGGPDLNMWMFKDSDEPSGPTYVYYFPTNPINLSGDDEGKWIKLPFSFKYNDAFYDSIFVTTNGYFSFSSISVTGANGPLPYPSSPNNAVYPLWDDLIITGTGGIDTATYGSPPHRLFVIRWKEVQHYGGSNPVDFEAILYEEGEKVLFQYRDVIFSSTIYDSGASATVGIENEDGTCGLQYSYNQKTLKNAFAILFYRIESFRDVKPVRITAPGINPQIGEEILPEAEFTNFGTQSADFIVEFKIFNENGNTVYTSQQPVTSLAPFDTVSVTFDPWIPQEVGKYRFLAITELEDDQNHENDTIESYGVAGYTGRNFVIIDLDMNHSNGIPLYKVLEQNGYHGIYRENPSALDSLTGFNTAWVFLGTPPFNYVLSHSDALNLINYLQNGGNLLLSGADAFAHDSTRWLIDPYFGIKTDVAWDITDTLTEFFGWDNSLIPSINYDQIWHDTLENYDFDHILPMDGDTNEVEALFGFSTKSKTIYYIGIAYRGALWNSIALSFEPAGFYLTDDGTPWFDSLSLWFMNFLQGPHYEFHDIQVQKILLPFQNFVKPGKPFNPLIVVKNRGTFDETYVPFKVYITSQAGDTVYQSGIILMNFSKGVSETLRFPSWLPPQDSGDYMLYAVSQFEDDVSNNNTKQFPIRTYNQRGDILDLVDLTSLTGRQVFNGIFAMKNRIYLTEGSGILGNFNTLYVLDREYHVLNSFAQNTSGIGYTEIGGFLFDTSGTAYIYAVCCDTLKKLLISDDSISMVWQKPLPVSGVHGVTYNPENRKLYLTLETGPILRIDPSGNLLKTYYLNLPVYGSAFVPFTKNRNSGIWLSIQAPDNSGFLNKLLFFDLSEEKLTDSLELRYPYYMDSVYAAGLAHAFNWNGKEVLFEILQSVHRDYLAAIYLGDTPEENKTGDIDGDNWVTPRDFELLAQEIFYIQTIPGKNPADVNKDGIVDPEDLSYLAKYVFGRVDMLDLK